MVHPQTQEVFFVYSPDRSQLLYLSSAYEQIWGRTTESLYQNPMSWVEALHPEDRDRVTLSLEQRPQGEAYAEEYRIVQPDGTIRWISVRSSPAYDQSGELEQIVELAEDVTERKSSEQQLHHLNRWFRTISECNQALVRATDEVWLLQEICRILVQFGGYCFAWIGLAERDGSQQIRPVAQATSDSNDYLESIQLSWADNELGSHPTGIAIRTGRACTTQDLLHDPRYLPWRETALQYGYGSTIALPLIQDNLPFGALNLYATQPHTFGPEEVKLLTELANDLAYGIVALRTQTALHGSEARFRIFLEAASEAVVVSKANGEIVLFNSKAEEIFGYSQSEVLNRSVEFLMPERFRDGHIRFRSGYHTQPSRRSMGQARNLYALHKDGSEFPIEAGLSSVQIGDERFVLTFLTDITERKQAEEAVKKSEEQLRLVLQNMPVMLDALNDAGHLIIWNQECERVTGYAAAEVINNSAAMELLYPDPTYRNHMMTEWAKQGNRYRNWEWDITCKDGSTKTIAWSNLSEEFPIPGWASWGIGIDVTQRKQAETALRQANQELENRVANRTAELSQLNDRLQQELIERERSQQILQEQTQLLDLAHDTIMTCDPDGKITFWNQGATQMYGWTSAEAIGRASHQLLHTQFPKSLAEIRAELFAHGYWEGELVHLHRNGTPITVASRWVLQRKQNGEPTKILEINNDITERKRAEETRLRLAAIVESSDDGIVSTTLDGIIMSWNTGAERVYGYSASEMLGQQVQLLLPPDRRHEEAFILDQLRQNKRIEHYETMRRHKEGKLIVVSLTVSPLKNADGEIIGISKIARDITDRKKTEEQLSLSSERISLANAELARAARLKDEFLAGMSHELRTPLNAILGLSEALLEEIFGALSHEQREHLTTIEQSGRHLLELINDILDLSKVESGKMELEIQPIPIQQLCDSSLSFVKQQAHLKRIRLECRIDDTLTEVEVDERRIRQVLVNLLSNAVKFTLDGGGVQLQVRADSFRETVEFSVTDTGIGIAPENIGKLFQPFVQLDSSLSRRYAGTGLGLALVRRICELHGGSVTLESQEGKGSRFTITLPWNPLGQVAEDTNVESEEVAVQHLNLQHVLVIEDSEAAANQITRYLTELGATTLVHTLGRGAVQVALQSQPEVIILDILLPDRSGWEILTELKTNPITRSIPVVVISVIDERSRSIEMGAAAHLLKPITRQQLQQALFRVTASIKPSGSQPTPVSASIQPDTLPLVLLAEDNETNVATLNSYLQARGLQVVLARNGLEAIQMAKQHKPDLILMDIQMPEMDGLEATQRIRTEPELQGIPIIALTALAMPGDRERCLAVGATDYLTKPVSLKHLFRILSNYVPQLQPKEANQSDDP